MAKNGFNFGSRGGAFDWLVVLVVVLAFVYYLYEGGGGREGVSGLAADGGSSDPECCGSTASGYFHPGCRACNWEPPSAAKPPKKWHCYLTHEEAARHKCEGGPCPVCSSSIRRTDPSQVRGKPSWHYHDRHHGGHDHHHGEHRFGDYRHDSQHPHLHDHTASPHYHD